MLPTLEAEQSRRLAERQGATLARDLDSSKARCEHFHGFVREAWHVLEPTTPFIDGWAVKAICDHLEAISDGRITRLLINCPPGFAKSLLVSCLWPAWEWTRDASLRFLTTTHEAELAIRDNLRMRRLVESDWYQRRWGDKVQQTRDQWGKTRFENTATGWRECRAFISMIGGRGDRVIIDDPNTSTATESDVQRNEVARVFREDIPHRVNDWQTSAIVVIMQRLHEQDISGIILREGLGYVHLMLPMEFEPDRRCETEIGFSDPRVYPGELLAPERIGRSGLERVIASLKAYGKDGQLQQRPSSREGNLFKVGMIEIVKTAPRMSKVVRAWDFAGTKRNMAQTKALKNSTDPDWSAGVKVGRDIEGGLWVLDVTRFRETPGVVRQRVKAIASQDGYSVRVRIPRDPAQAGKDQAETYVRWLVGFKLTVKLARGDKATRAEAAISQVENGNIKLLWDGTEDGSGWNQAFLDELRTFPNGAHDDQVDAFGDAVNELSVVISGEGLAEYYHQETIREAYEAEPYTDDDMVALLPPPALGQAYGRDGACYQKGADGVMKVAPEDAKSFLGLPGWRRAEPAGV